MLTLPVVGNKVKVVGCGIFCNHFKGIKKVFGKVFRVMRVEGQHGGYQIWFLAAEQPPQETFHVDDDFSAEVAEVISNPAHFEILG